jgi:hypothetical protein
MADVKALRIFLNVDLRNSHEGLSAIATKNKIDVKKLVAGEYLIFINSEKNKIKLYAANEVIAYYRCPHGKVDLRAISKIPQAFKASGKIDYDACLKEIMEAKLK